MVLDLCTLTICVSFRPVVDIRVHAWPNKMFLDELCGTNTWLREIVKRSKEFTPKGGWHNRSWVASGNVTDERHMIKRFSNKFVWIAVI